MQAVHQVHAHVICQPKPQCMDSLSFIVGYCESELPYMSINIMQRLSNNNQKLSGQKKKMKVPKIHIRVPITTHVASSPRLLKSNDLNSATQIHAAAKQLWT